jgi:ferredoxin/truncated hemoglobin YjbI|nr:2Fe-2S iron-sulfur cluster-binding protein [uncultured Acidovorax sp.]
MNILNRPSAEPPRPLHAIHYQGQALSCRENETLLDALLRTGASIDFSCKSGVCRRCLVKVQEGTAPHRASRSLPDHLRSAGYVLACQCRPNGPLRLAPKSAADMLTACMLVQREPLRDGGCALWFEPATELAFAPGQAAELCGGPFTAPVRVRLAERDDAQGWVRADVHGAQALPLLPPSDVRVGDDPLFGASFELRGPYPQEPAGEMPPPPPDPALWRSLQDGLLVRRVLESFYRKVYADPLLQPFFERVSMDRVIGKQYSFLMHCMTGTDSYIGERPKNAHHWMVIPDTLFEHRQQLMAQAQREYGLTPDQCAGWTRLEEHFRADIVKFAPWPRRVGGDAIDTERYDTVTLDEATVCDHCGAEIAAHTTVRYHARLGQVGCARCARG